MVPSSARTIGFYITCTMQLGCLAMHKHLCALCLIMNVEGLPTPDTTHEPATEQFASKAWMHHWTSPLCDWRRHEHGFCSRANRAPVSFVISHRFCYRANRALVSCVSTCGEHAHNYRVTTKGCMISRLAHTMHPAHFASTILKKDFLQRSLKGLSF